MTEDKKTARIIAHLEASAGRPLARPQEIAMLLERAPTPERLKTLDEASFIAKFLVRTMGIMRRIGSAGTGYEQLEREFGANTRRLRELLGSLVEGAPDDIRENFTATFLAVTPSAFDHLLSLCDDLMRYKNWRLDEERGNAIAP